MVGPPEVTQYPWGKGVTQRRRFFGEGAPDFYSYQCAYFGMAGTTRFELTVDEIADRAQADKWAAKAAETAAKTSRSGVEQVVRRLSGASAHRRALRSLWGPSVESIGGGFAL